jgi:cbb3-type cytochrome oxidase maturation protein
MDAMIFLIPAALSLAGLGLAAFLWSLHAGQYEDLEGAAMRILTDEDEDGPKD